MYVQRNVLLNVRTLIWIYGCCNSYLKMHFVRFYSACSSISTSISISILYLDFETACSIFSAQIRYFTVCLYVGIHWGCNMFLRLHWIRHYCNHWRGSYKSQEIDSSGYHMQLGDYPDSIRNELPDVNFNW